MFLHNLLNVLVQIANKMGLQTKNYFQVSAACCSRFSLEQTPRRADFETVCTAEWGVLIACFPWKEQRVLHLKHRHWNLLTSYPHLAYSSTRLAICGHRDADVSWQPQLKRTSMVSIIYCDTVFWNTRSLSLSAPSSDWTEDSHILHG
jgi:hypothetical protein